MITTVGAFYFRGAPAEKNGQKVHVLRGGVIGQYFIGQYVVMC
jgi:hypothetical protein